MNLGSRGPVVIDTGVFGARLAPSGGYSPRCTGQFLKPGRQLSLLSPLPSWSTEPGWPTGPRSAPAAGVRDWPGRDRLAWAASHRGICHVACLVRQDGSWLGPEG